MGPGSSWDACPYMLAAVAPGNNEGFRGSVGGNRESGVGSRKSGMTDDLTSRLTNSDLRLPIRNLLTEVVEGGECESVVERPELIHLVFGLGVERLVVRVVIERRGELARERDWLEGRQLLGRPAG